MANYNLETETTVHIKGMSMGEGDANGGGNVSAGEVISRIDDASMFTEDGSITLTVWGDPDSHPFGWSPYRQFMVNPDSELESSVFLLADSRGSVIQGSIPMLIPERYRESAKYAIMNGINAYVGSRYVEGYWLVVKIIGYGDDGYPICEALNGRQMYDDMLMPTIPEGTKAVLLTDGYRLPDDDSVMRGSKVHCVVLSADCQVLSNDAKKGDVYCRSADSVFGDLSVDIYADPCDLILKFYSFEEKLQAIKDNPDALLPAPDASGLSYNVRCADSLNFSELRPSDNVAGGFFLLLNDATANSASYKKGEFLFIDFDAGNRITKIPFDYFVTSVTKKSE